MGVHLDWVTHRNPARSRVKSNDSGYALCAMHFECPRDLGHGPHDERALFCWVCGEELECVDCGRPIGEHQFRVPICPIVKVQLPPLLPALD